MPTRLVALAGGTDILMDRVLVPVRRLPTCDVRLDSSCIDDGAVQMNPEGSCPVGVGDCDLDGRR